MSSVLATTLRGISAPARRALLTRTWAPTSCQMFTRTFATTYYMPSHEWLKLEDDGTATLGITDFAQDELGEIVFADLPDVGATFDAKETCVTLESVKAVGEVYAPGSLEITETNGQLNDEPALVNKKAESDGWLIKAKFSGDTSGMMSRSEYDAHVA